MFDNPEFIVLRDERLGSWFIDECENDKRDAIDCVAFCFSRASQDVPFKAGLASGVCMHDLYLNAC